MWSNISIGNEVDESSEAEQKQQSSESEQQNNDCKDW